MGYNTQSTEWPEADIAPETKNLIDRFFNLLDSEDPEVGNVLADEIFAQDGKAYFGGHLFSGPAEIRKSRDNAWGAIIARRHKVLRAYVHSPKAQDILFIGHVKMTFRNKKTVEGEFAGRLIVSVAGGRPRLDLYQVWGDSSAIVKALQELAAEEKSK